MVSQHLSEAFGDVPLWPVVLGLSAWWVVLLVRAILWRAVPWYLKAVSLVAYPMAVAALFMPRYEYALGLPAIGLIWAGFVIDGLWRRTDVLGRFDDAGRRPLRGRRRRR
ncbi:hypothetical protein [Micromonospora siamensis]|uniref:Uncharacterized protein n=1 Tax=Micromonospora siamensis TaxID=299152 RepID=A0A1C5JT48_9ACTN|nr:hypothetical protein [Micromonospora siamensis]SCG73429.1 hypothetical protein GA0074704_4909 [Micromonospora siamensis]